MGRNQFVMRKLLLFIFFLLACPILAQVVSVTPHTAGLDDNITLIFDASKGNKALAGYNGTIYAHTGVTTSPTNDGWQYVQGNWGTADAPLALTPLGNDQYSLTMNIRTFYGIPQGVNVYKLAFVFRNQDGSIVARAEGNTDIFWELYDPVLNHQPLPPNIEDGINYIDNSTVILSLFAPNKDSVYVKGDFSNWQINANHKMYRTHDGRRYWIELSGLIPQQEYAYQFWIDGYLTVADPLCEKVLDPWNDWEISNVVYPNLKAYPFGQTDGIVSIFQTDQTPYNWVAPTIQNPAKTDLVIYELLIRDFIDDHHYLTLIDSLDYFQRLGINVIELMPITEFEGNKSWGYNPDYMLAPDKYYGTQNHLKAFIDACHQRGISVIMDMVLNHAFGLSPMVQMYWDGSLNQPTNDSPWFNSVGTHDFGTGFDFNHQSYATQNYVERVLNHWIDNYKIDGFRFDLSKGFTQNNTLGNIGAWNAYDVSRVNLWKQYGDMIWAKDADSYLILEHFANNDEETELANYGFMLWGNLNHSFSEASMSWISSSDFGWASYQHRGWSQPHLVSYMESHDEERVMYKTLLYGNGVAGYDTQDFPTALERSALNATFYFSLPGPKMIWQFGELGYDYSINHCADGSNNGGCRTDPKPIRWDYEQEPLRRDLFEVYAKMIHLKKNYAPFKTTNYDIDLGGNTKRITLYHNDFDVNVVGNFDVVAQNDNVYFPYTGWWYDCFTQDSIYISNTYAPLALEAGEYRLYTSQKINQGVTFQAKVLLEGAYNENGMMHTNLNEFIPLTHPYNVAPYNYADNESLSSIPANMVDWVLVEARSGTPSPTGSRSTITVETKAALLLNDGSIVAADGNPLRFENLNNGQAYHFCIRHRNHLDILTSNALNTTANLTYDFTNNINQAFGSLQQKMMTDGFAVMYAGDYTQDGVIQLSDFDAWKVFPAQINLYDLVDGNLDGVVQVTDFDIWVFNKAKIGAVEIGF